MTILSRFIISITSWLGNPRFYSWALGLLVLLSCNDELSEVGFKNPNRDFDVVAKEFIIPSKMFLMDSVTTSTGVIANNADGLFNTPSPQRMMCGNIEDPRFGKVTAIGYSPYWSSLYPTVDAAAVYEGLDLTMIFDYYWSGSETASEQTFQVYELTDSLLTYLPHFGSSSTPYGRLLGEGKHVVSPDDFEANLDANADLDDTNNIMDSLNIKMDDDLGRALFAASQDTIGTAEDDFVTFKKFRRKFKGLAFVSPGSDKIVGFDMVNAKTRMTLKYRVDTTHYQVEFIFLPPGQAAGTAEYMAYTELKTDRTGTPIAGLATKYEDFVPADGMRYVQAGTGVVTKLDFTEVFDFFKNVPNKALSVAELRIESEEQRQSPLSFKLRALRANNRELKSSTTYYDDAEDPFENWDPVFLAKHLFVLATAQRPYLRCDVIGDDGGEFSLGRVSNDGSVLYAGYLTNFFQQELSLEETDIIRYYALLPQQPDNARGVDRLYFPADNVKLTVYYTTPKATN